jgi:parvulin-like peptidyl-prolyl isomerase
MNLKKSLLVLLCTAFILLPPSQSFATLNDGILAIVNDDIITLKDLHEFLSTVYMGLSSSKLSQQEIKETMAYYQENGLEKIIDERLKINHADKMELKIRPETVEKRIEDIKKQYPSDKAFTDDLMAQGMTLTDLRKKVLDQFKAYYAEELEIKSKILVSPQQVTEFYQKNLYKFLTPERLTLNSIFIPYENSNKNLATRRAQDALAIIKDPAQLSQYPKGFDEVAQEFSGIATTSTVNKNEMLPEVEAAVAKLNISEISELVPTEKGIYLFRLIEKAPEVVTPLEKVKDKIYDMLFQQQLSERREAWLKKLRQNAYIEIKQ